MDRLEDVEWNTKPFDNLVLPDGYKDLILAFVESQMKNGHVSDDLISGKGNWPLHHKPYPNNRELIPKFISSGGGLVILLSGTPGVGKTLTVESGENKQKTFIIISFPAPPIYICHADALILSPLP